MTQPGWYEDPWSPVMLRWWDGRQWTSAANPRGGPDPGADIAEEDRAGRTASRALMFGAVGYASELVVQALLVGAIWPAYRRWIDALRYDNTARLVLPRNAIALDLASTVCSIGLLIVGIFFLMWFDKAAKVALHAGVPARRRPGWAIGGWFIPIGNLFLPYQSAVDLLPSGHPGRHTVKRWWTLWLATSLAGLVVAVGSIAATGVGLALALAAGLLAFAAASAGVSVIDEVNRAHARLVGR